MFRMSDTNQRCAGDVQSPDSLSVLCEMEDQMKEKHHRCFLVSGK